MGKEVREEIIICSKLFKFALEYVFSMLDRGENSINIDGRHLHYLRFADHIVLISNNSSQDQNMFSDIKIASEKIGLTITFGKRKVCI